MSKSSIVIAGAGQAGFQAAASLREKGHDGSIVLVGDEPSLPYQHPPLSKSYLLGKLDHAALQFRPESFFRENRIEHRAGLKIETIDREAHQAVLQNGEAIPYDHLILALGARNRPLPVPGAGLKGVFQLRTVEDADALRESLDRGRQVVVIGGGFIGLEFATIAAERGAEVTVIETADRPMARVLSKEMSSYFRTVHEAHGIRFIFGATAARLSGNSKVEVVETLDGQQFPADLVLVCIGVIPNTEIASQAGLATGNGIIVNEYLVTSDPTISAIGDCALHPNPYAASGIIRLESVQGAVDQARCVADRLTGHPAPYCSLPWFWSEQGTLRLQIAGLTQPHDHTVVRKSPPGEKEGMSVYCFRANRLVGVESANRPLDHALARKLLSGKGETPGPEQVATADFELKAWVKD
ncbi:NAD(P)/FAD-dependent oxidoreductase [Acidocella sp.]|uniref:NAD(P)/FAD-dependent oxidoreductase n=1 Tax=Acidocella sp. TaxID=50710 RepID=UPI00261E224E|nr:FAD-dependent oxidoreductase [Acidocella sp.]